MNRQGILVDISQISDKTFYDVLEITKVGLIASHSSCRQFRIIHAPWPTR
jgi:membrane dipeptidase